jgi:hypothetical protein
MNQLMLVKIKSFEKLSKIKRFSSSQAVFCFCGFLIKAVIKIPMATPFKAPDRKS